MLGADNSRGKSGAATAANCSMQSIALPWNDPAVHIGKLISSQTGESDRRSSEGSHTGLLARANRDA